MRIPQTVHIYKESRPKIKDRAVQRHLLNSSEAPKDGDLVATWLGRLGLLIEPGNTDTAEHTTESDWDHWVHCP